jgi:hypothetical protein
MSKYIFTVAINSTITEKDCTQSVNNILIFFMHHSRISVVNFAYYELNACYCSQDGWQLGMYIIHSCCKWPLVSVYVFASDSPSITTYYKNGYNNKKHSSIFVAFCITIINTLTLIKITCLQMNVAIQCLLNWYRYVLYQY